jgi:hypothetical protein
MSGIVPSGLFGLRLPRRSENLDTALGYCPGWL